MADKITLKEFMEKTTAAIKSQKELLAEIIKANDIKGTIEELLNYVKQNSHIFSDDNVEAKIPTLEKLMGKRNATQLQFSIAAMRNEIETNFTPKDKAPAAPPSDLSQDDLADLLGSDSEAMSQEDIENLIANQSGSAEAEDPTTEPAAAESGPMSQDDIASLFSPDGEGGQPAEDEGPMSQDDIENLIAQQNAGGEQAAPEIEDEGPMSQDDIENLIAQQNAGGDQDAPETKDEGPMSQDDIENLIAQQNAGGNQDAPETEDEGPMSQDDIENLIAQQNSGGEQAFQEAEDVGPMSQDDIENLIAQQNAGEEQAAQEAAPETEEDSGPMSQDDIENLIAQQDGTGPISKEEIDNMVAPEPEEDSGPMSQDDIENLISKQSSEETEAPVDNQEQDSEISQEEIEKLLEEDAKRQQEEIEAQMPDEGTQEELIEDLPIDELPVEELPVEELSDEELEETIGTPHETEDSSEIEKLFDQSIENQQAIQETKEPAGNTDLTDLLAKLDAPSIDIEDEEKTNVQEGDTTAHKQIKISEISPENISDPNEMLGQAVSDSSSIDLTNLSAFGEVETTLKIDNLKNMPPASEMGSVDISDTSSATVVKRPVPKLSDIAPSSGQLHEESTTKPFEVQIPSTNLAYEPEEERIIWQKFRLYLRDKNGLRFLCEASSEEAIKSELSRALASYPQRSVVLKKLVRKEIVTVKEEELEIPLKVSISF